MKIAYVVDWKGKPNAGAPQKIHDQISIWRDNQCIVDLYSIVPHQYEAEWKLQSKKVFIYSNVFQRIIARAVCAINVIRDKEINLVYRRFAIWEFLEIISFLIKPTVVEINTNNKEYYKGKSLLFLLVLKIQNLIISRYVVGACSVTEELRIIQSTRIRHKTKVFTNSIKLQVKSSNLLANNHKFGQRISLVFLASDSFKWNGIEILAVLATDFPDFDFHVVGLTGLNTKNLFWYGPLYGEELSNFLFDMDFGISTLAIDSLNLKQAAPLKSRTYLAHGLPTIGAYQDSAFIECDFFLQVVFDKNTFQLLDKKQFLAFINKWNGKKVNLERLDSINSNVVERNRSDFMRSLVE